MKTYEVLSGRIFGRGPGETFRRKLDEAQERRLVGRGNIRVKRKKKTDGPKSGSKVVGESGPEAVKLPKGTTVEKKDTPTNGGSTNQSKED